MSTESVEKYVNGEWNGFLFRSASDSDYPEIAKFIRAHYFPDEPTTQLMGYSEELGEDYDTLCRPTIRDGLSFLAYDKETKELAGVRITYNHPKDKDWSAVPIKSEKAGRLLTCIHLLDDQFPVFEKFPISNIAFLLLTAVHKDFRGRGLSGEMYRRSINLLRAEGFFLAKCTFSSPFSRASATKAGFKEVSRLSLKEAKDENGHLIFPNATDQLMTQSIYVLHDSLEA